VSIAVAATLATNCGDNPTAPQFPSDAPYIEGKVTAVTTVSTRSVSVRVEANPADMSGSPKTVARVDDFTIVRMPGNVEGDFTSIEVGQWVRLWNDGAVLDSYPTQTVARAVVVDSLERGN
jgi:hypothetical protein